MMKILSAFGWMKEKRDSTNPYKAKSKAVTVENREKKAAKPTTDQTKTSKTSVWNFEISLTLSNTFYILKYIPVIKYIGIYYIKIYNWYVFKLIKTLNKFNFKIYWNNIKQQI